MGKGLSRRRRGNARGGGTLAAAPEFSVINFIITPDLPARRTPPRGNPPSDEPIATRIGADRLSWPSENKHLGKCRYGRRHAVRRPGHRGRAAPSALGGHPGRDRRRLFRPRVGTHPHPVTAIGSRAPTCRCCSPALADATDALARLDARAAASPTPSGRGCIARMAFAEAAGWLAHTHAWVHPLDLALRDLGLTAPTALAAVGAGTAPCRRPSPGPPRTATGPIRRSRRWPGLTARSPRHWHSPGCCAASPENTGRTQFASATAAAETLASLGAGELDEENLSAWWSAHAPQPDARRRRYGMRGGEGGDPPLPPLLHAAHAAQSLDGGRHHRAPGARPRAARRDRPGRPRRRRPAPCSSPSGRPTRPPASAIATHLPTLRSDAADRLVGRGRPVTWPFAFLHLVAESARAGLRELDRLDDGRGAGQGARCRRSTNGRGCRMRSTRCCARRC